MKPVATKRTTPVVTAVAGVPTDERSMLVLQLAVAGVAIFASLIMSLAR